MKRTEISRQIAKVVKSQFGVDLEPEIEYAERQFGDFTTNAPFKLAGQLKRSPHEIAVELAAAIQNDDIETVQPAGGGYVNMAMKNSYWAGRLLEVSEGYGRLELGEAKKVQVEFISANPTGPTTFGNARGGFIGDVIARVLERCGNKVTREYYFNDGGTQISKLVESVKSAAGLVKVKEVQYSGEYIQDLANEFGERMKDATDEESARLLTDAILGRYIEPAVAKMKIKFDEWFNERTLDETGQVEEAFERLRQKDLLYEKDGAVWMASAKLGDERDRVLRKSTGDLTYLANDIAYHLNIFERRGFDKAVKQFGADHVGQIPSLRLALQALAPGKELDFNIHQWVRLIRDGKEVKMSKRAGSYVTVEEVIDEIGSDVCRFFFLMRSADSQMDFELDLAKEQSQKNPYWYVMYSYARAGSILREADIKGLVPSAKIDSLNGYERQLVKQMVRLPELIAETAGDYEVQRLSYYGIELARQFHDYYESERIINQTKEVAEQKLLLIQRYQKLMVNYFELIGIEPLERM